MKSAACLALWAATGCSLVLTHAPPENAPPTVVPCTESKLVVALDMAATAAAVLFAVDALVASQQSNCDSWWCVDSGHRAGAGAAGLVLAVGFGFSAGVGDGRVDRCRGHNRAARAQ